ncbi:MAG: ABC transporter permease [Pseudomonadota bacterium]
MGRTWTLIRRRVLQAIPVILIVSIGIFGLLELAGGDAVDAYLAVTGGGDPAFAERLRQQWGLDAGLWVRFLAYVESLVTLDFGWSVVMSKPVSVAILERLPNTALMMGAAIAFSACLGTLLGGIAALRRGTAADAGITVGALVLNAMPSFWIGLIAIVVFAVKLAWFPLGGIASFDRPELAIGRVFDVAWHLVLPVTVLGLAYMALYVRLMRSAMIETAASDWVRAARARGLPRSRIVRRHMARPALLPVVTMLGLQAGNLLGGSVVVETVFAIPGLGSMAYDAVSQRDLPLIAGILLVGTLMVILVNLLVDITYARLDPRVTDDRVRADGGA